MLKYLLYNYSLLNYVVLLILGTSDEKNGSKPVDFETAIAYTGEPLKFLFRSVRKILSDVLGLHLCYLTLDV